MGIFSRKYTISELLTTDSSRQEKAMNSKVSLVRKFYEVRKETIFGRFRSLVGNKSSALMYYVILQFQVISDTGNVHTVYIKVDSDFDLSLGNSNRVEIYCDCADFSYRSAWALNEHGSLFQNSRIRAILGRSLTEKPKREATSILCKHSYAALSWLLDNYRGVMKDA